MSDSPARELALRISKTLEFLGNPVFDRDAPFYCGKIEDLPERIMAWNPSLTDDRLLAKYWERPADDARPLTGRFLEIGQPYWVHHTSNSRIVVGKVVLAGFKLGTKSLIAFEANTYTVRMNTGVKVLVLGGKWDHPTKVRHLEKIERRDALKSPHQLRLERDRAKQCQEKRSVTLWQTLRFMATIDQRISLGLPDEMITEEAQFRSRLLETIRSHAGCPVDDLPAFFHLSRAARRKFGEYRDWYNNNILTL